MGSVLKWIGVIWAIVGAANVFMTAGAVSDTTRGLGLIFNMVLFIIPGLILAGIGVAISRKPAAESAAASNKPAADRLQELAGLREAGAISASDYEARKQAILKSI